MFLPEQELDLQEKELNGTPAQASKFAPCPITSSTLPNLEAAGEKDPSELETLPVKSSLAALAHFQWEGVSYGYKLRLPKKNSVLLLWARLPCDCTFLGAFVFDTRSTVSANDPIRNEQTSSSSVGITLGQDQTGVGAPVATPVRKRDEHSGEPPSKAAKTEPATLTPVTPASQGSPQTGNAPESPPTPEIEPRDGKRPAWLQGLTIRQARACEIKFQQ